MGGGNSKKQEKQQPDGSKPKKDNKKAQLKRDPTIQALSGPSALVLQSLETGDLVFFEDPHSARFKGQKFTHVGVVRKSQAENLIFMMTCGKRLETLSPTPIQFKTFSTIDSLVSRLLTAESITVVRLKIDDPTLRTTWETKFLKYDKDCLDEKAISYDDEFLKKLDFPSDVDIVDFSGVASFEFVWDVLKFLEAVKVDSPDTPAPSVEDVLAAKIPFAPGVGIDHVEHVASLKARSNEPAAKQSKKKQDKSSKKEKPKNSAQPSPPTQESSPSEGGKVEEITSTGESKTVSFDEIAPTLKTGDIVLFSGKSVKGHIIRFFTKSEFSHVGIVWRIPDLPDCIFISESSTNLAKLKDVEDGHVKRGVELLDFYSKVFCGLYDRVAVRRLKYNPPSDFHSKLDTFRRSLKNVSYEENKVELIRSAWESNGFGSNHQSDLSSLFCSEYVAESFIRVGLLPKDPPSNNYTPQDFNHPSVRGRLKKDATLDAALFIKLE